MIYKDYDSDDEILDEEDDDLFDEDDEPDVYEYKVVGVTFSNDDGTNRQELLRKIKRKEAPFKGFINYSLREYSYEGKTAVAVLANGITIGNVPKENAENIAKHMQYISNVFVRVFGGEDGKKHGAIVRLTVTPPRIDVEKLIAKRRAASTPPSAPPKPTPQKRRNQFPEGFAEWIKKPLTLYLLAAAGIVLVILLVISHIANNPCTQKDLVGLSAVSSEQEDARLALSYETFCAIGQVVGKLNNITFQQIEYLNETGAYSAGLYSPDNGIVSMTFYSDAPNANAKDVNVKIDSALVTDESAKIVGDAFDQLLRFLDSDAYMNVGFSKIYKELSASYESDGTRGTYYTKNLEFNYRVISDDIVITIYPK